jgi:hypothetical protein
MMTELVRLHGEDLGQPWALLPAGASLGPEGIVFGNPVVQSEKDRNS